MRCATRRRQHQLRTEGLTFSGATIQPSSTVRDLGVILDTELSFGPHVNQLVSRCFHQLRRIKSSVRALPTEAAKTVVNSFVVSRIDYCNSLLAGAPQYQLDRLQAVINTAARLIYGVGKFDRPVSSVDARQRLRSATREDLVISRTATKFGARSFTVAARSEWNRLPLHIRSKPPVNCFKVALKSFLFTTDSS